MNMKKNLLVLFCLFMAGKYFGQDVPPSERDALTVIFDSMNGSNWVNKTNWKTIAPVSTWYGIKVTTFSDGPHVTGINLYKNNLYGEVPTAIENLLQLDTLFLDGNDIYKIPEEIGSLSKLKYLGLRAYSKNFTGRRISILPNSIGKLSNLEKLDVANQNLTGLPQSVENLKKLKSLDLSDNLFTSFPNVISSLTSLESINFQSNSVSGILPLSFSNLTNLKEIRFNQQNMEITDSYFFKKMKNLKTVFLGDMKVPYYIDFSANPMIFEVTIVNKNLEVINLKNGNNSVFTQAYFSSDIGSNASVKCVAVDQPINAIYGYDPYKKIKVSFKDGVKNFTYDCSGFLSVKDFKHSDFKISNPVKDFLNIQTSYKINKIEVYSVAGQLVKTFKTKDANNVSNLVKGNYILKIFTDSGVTSQKIIKE